MASFSLSFGVLAAVFIATQAGGHGPMQGESRMARMGWGGQQPGQRQGADQGWRLDQQGPIPSRPIGADQGWRLDQQGTIPSRQIRADSKYRSSILDDDDVYGYEAKYPNGEVLFVNYRNSEARSRRGPDFARSNSISARSSGRQGQEGGFKQQGPEGGFRQGHQEGGFRSGGFRQQRGGMGMEDQHNQW